MVTTRLWELERRITSLEKENEVGIHGLLSVKYHIIITYHFYRKWVTVFVILYTDI